MQLSKYIVRTNIIIESALDNNLLEKPKYLALSEIVCLGNSNSFTTNSLNLLFTWFQFIDGLQIYCLDNSN